MKITRLAPGNYSVSDGVTEGRIVHVETGDLGDGYGARNHWIVDLGMYSVSDPQPTLRDAKIVARDMLASL